MDSVADLQAQIIALRAAVEGAWLAMLRRDGDAHAQAERIGRESVEAIGQLDAKSAECDGLAKMHDGLSREIDVLNAKIKKMRTAIVSIDEDEDEEDENW